MREREKGWGEGREEDGLRWRGREGIRGGGRNVKERIKRSS